MVSIERFNIKRSCREKKYIYSRPCIHSHKRTVSHRSREDDDAKDADDP